MRRFLRALQGGELPGGVHLELIERIGEPAFRALVAEGVLIRGDRATVYPCPGGGSDCPRDVVENPGDPEFPFVAVSPGPELCCPPVRLTEADLATKRTSRPALVGLLSRLFGIEGPANLGAEVFRRTHRLGRSRWGGAGEREVWLCTSLSSTEALGHLLARKVMRQPTLVLSNARSRFTPPELEAHYGRSEMVEVVFLEDYLALDNDRVVLRGPIGPREFGTAESAADEEAPFCVLIDHEGRHEIDKATYREVAGRQQDYDLFINILSSPEGSRVEVGRRELDGSYRRDSLTSLKAWAYAELVERRKLLRPTELTTLKGTTRARKHLEEARARVDVQTHRYQWRSTQRYRSQGVGENAYLFDPPEDLRFAILRPFEAPSS